MVRGPLPAEEPRIVLVGGAAGSGKTTIASALAKQLRVLFLQAGAFWLALKAVTTPAQYPELHLFPGLDEAEGLTTEQLRDCFIAAEVVCRAIEPAIRFQSHVGPGLVLEGAWLLPSFAAKLAGPDVTGTPVRSVFLFEPDPEEVLRAMFSRSESPEVTPAHRRLAEMSWLFGCWLRDECERLGLPVVEVRPRETLLARALASPL